jgi:hypothetical protein
VDCCAFRIRAEIFARRKTSASDRKSGVFDSSDGTAKGKPLNSNAAQFFGPSAVDVDPENSDVYVADGHGGGNTRIAVLDKNGTFLRKWRMHHTEAERDIEVLPHCMRLYQPKARFKANLLATMRVTH